MRILLVFLSVCIYNITYAQDRSVCLEEADWEQVIAKAKRENKMLFIDCNAVWCNPCKVLIKDVFSRNSVADYYNENFISVSYDIEKDKAPDIINLPRITSIPLLLFVDPSTLTVVYAKGGSVDEAGALKIAQMALDKRWRLEGMRERFEKGERDEILVIPYLEVLRTMVYRDEYQKVITDYWDKMTVERLTIPENWGLFERKVNDPVAPIFQLAWKGQNQIAVKIGEERVKNKLEGLLEWNVKYDVRRRSSEEMREKLIGLKNYISTLNWGKRDFSISVLAIAEKACQQDYDELLKRLKHFIRKYGTVNEEIGEYVLIFCEKLKRGATSKQILTGIKYLDQVAKDQIDIGMRSRLMYLKRDMLKAAGYEKEAMRADTLATKIMNPHFYDK